MPLTSLLRESSCPALKMFFRWVQHSRWSVLRGCSSEQIQFLKRSTTSWGSQNSLPPTSQLRSLFTQHSFGLVWWSWSIGYSAMEPSRDGGSIGIYSHSGGSHMVFAFGFVWRIYIPKRVSFISNFRPNEFVPLPHPLIHFFTSHFVGGAVGCGTEFSIHWNVFYCWTFWARCSKNENCWTNGAVKIRHLRFSFLGKQHLL